MANDGVKEFINQLLQNLDAEAEIREKAGWDDDGITDQAKGVRDLLAEVERLQHQNKENLKLLKDAWDEVDQLAERVESLEATREDELAATERLAGMWQAIRVECDTLRAEVERQSGQIKNFEAEFSELHAARNIFSRLSRAGFPLGEDVAESILGMRAEVERLRKYKDRFDSIDRSELDRAVSALTSSLEYEWEGEFRAEIETLNGAYMRYRASLKRADMEASR